MYVLTVYSAESWAPRCVAERQKCSAGTLLSGNVSFMVLFAGVR